jgi:protein subunit release factor A
MDNREELHLTKKDFRIEWFSGTGAGGQHRNKHQNCCRIIHLGTGLKAQGTESRERASNQRKAFNRLAKLILAHFYADGSAERRSTGKTIRNYHAVRNEVHDKASGLKRSYREVVVNGDLSEMIAARRAAMAGDSLLSGEYREQTE